MKKAALACLLLFFFSASSACKDDKPKGGDQPPPPPPPASGAGTQPGACGEHGERAGALSDPVSAPFFPKTVSGYCVDPQGEVRTYGEKGKLSMDQVCTTAFDGECEVYKGFGLRRVVSLHYVDGSGKGGSVEVNLSQFEGDAGAYGMFTMRVVAGDPADPSTPKPLAATAAGAIGTGRAYVWRGAYLAELQYNNETESPEQMAKSSEAILSALGKELGDKLPGPKTLPPAAQALPSDSRIPNGIRFEPKDVMGWKAIGPAAIGFYKEGDKRWRDLAIVKDDADQAKDVMKTIKSKAGALPVANVGDEAVHAVTPESEKGGPKIEMLVARKGSTIVGVADEEYALRGAAGEKARLSKDDALAKIKPLLSASAPSASSPSPAAAPSASASSAPKK